MATPLRTQRFARVTTTDATVTTCGFYTMADETVASIRVHVVGRTSGGDSASYFRVAGVEREGGAGAALIPIGVTGSSTREDVGAWDCTLDVDANDVRVRVTGAAATTINWLAEIEVLVLTP